MSMKCCNPKCEAPFDHREGRLVRFSGTVMNAKTRKTEAFIQHVWLCGRCAEQFVFERNSEHAIALKPRKQHLAQGSASPFVSVA